MFRFVPVVSSSIWFLQETTEDWFWMQIFQYLSFFPLTFLCFAAFMSTVFEFHVDIETFGVFLAVEQISQFSKVCNWAFSLISCASNTFLCFTLSCIWENHNVMHSSMGGIQPWNLGSTFWSFSLLCFTFCYLSFFFFHLLRNQHKYMNVNHKSPAVCYWLYM